VFSVVQVDALKINNINAEIREHWKYKYSKDEESSFHYWPIQYPSLNKNCLLFVGLNPSLKAKDKEKGTFVLKTKKSLEDTEKLTEIVKQDENDRGGPDRDGPCKYTLCQDVFEQINEPAKIFKSWDYIDLFSNRVLEAPLLRTHLDIRGDQEKVSWPPNKSAAEQLKIFKELLDSLKPKAVLVANALASYILIQDLGLNFTDCEKKGYSFLPSRNTLVFFSSTFSGGHLDIFNRQRLVDQIKATIAKNKR
jgi:hypothetical protein